MDNTLFLILFLAHLLGDFYFQGDSIAEEKHNRYSALIKHAVIYLSIAIIICIPYFSVNLLIAVTTVSVAHYMIDSIKYIFMRKSQRKITETMQDKLKLRLVYVVDQLMHILSIIVIGLIFSSNGYTAEPIPLISSKIQPSAIYDILRWTVLLLTMWKPINITLKHLLSPYKPSEQSADQIEQTESNNLRAGAFIGSLERTVMLILLAMQQYSAIGLVLTAKSIARYSKIQDDKAFAEYYLLGTLLSTLSAIMIFLLI